ncbi:AEC family transporter, partial [Enterococcus sp.]
MFDAYINIFVIFSLMFIGYILSYKQWFSNRTADTFSKLVLNLTLPANMFLTIIKNFTKEEFLSLVSGMVIPLLSMLITYMIGHLWRRFFHVAHKHKGAFSSMFTFSNTIFIGLPINLAIFGEKAVPYVLLYYIVNTTLFWT